MKNVKVFFVAFISFLLSQIVFMPTSLMVKVTLIVAPFLFIISFVQPFYAFLLFLLIRPSMDPLRNLSIGGVTFLSALGIFIFLLITIMYLKDRNFKIVPKTTIRFLLFFFFFSVLSLMNSDDISKSIEALLKTLSIIGIYILSYNFVKKETDVFVIIRTIIYSSFIPIIVGMFQIITRGGLVQGGFSGLRINSIFILSNVFARYLVIILILVIGMICNKNINNKEKRFFGIILILGLICLLKTYTISAWISFVVAIFILGIFERRILKISIPLFTVIIILFSDQFVGRIQSVIQTPKYGTTSIEFRKDITKQLLFNAFPEHPFFGFGIGTSGHIAEQYTSYRTLPHNDFIRALIETGIFGFSFYFLFMISLFLKSVKNFVLKKFIFHDVVFFSIFVGYFMVSFTSNVFSYVVTSGYLFCCFGMWDKLNSMNMGLKK